MNYKKYKKKNCKNCNNKSTSLCEIHTTIDGKCKCVYYERGLNQMNNKIYDVLKYFAQIILPAIATLYFALAGIWHWPFAEEIVGTITAIDTFLGCALKISSDRYYKKLEENKTE